MYILRVCKYYGFTAKARRTVELSAELRAVARALIGGGGGGVCIFIYSGSARLVSFEMKLIPKEVSRAEPEYMNMHPPISVLATALAELSVGRDCWRKLFPQVCSVIFCGFCHACHLRRIFNMLKNFMHE